MFTNQAEEAHTWLMNVSVHTFESSRSKRPCIGPDVHLSHKARVCFFCGSLIELGAHFRTVVLLLFEPSSSRVRLSSSVLDAVLVRVQQDAADLLLTAPMGPAAKFMARFVQGDMELAMEVLSAVRSAEERAARHLQHRPPLQGISRNNDQRAELTKAWFERSWLKRHPEAVSQEAW
jgi:hypothetical protein